MLKQITPVILTFNEEANIGRCLSWLTWAPEIVILDSGSTDRTREIATSFRQVRWVERPFDTHGNQWSYAIHQTGIKTDWVLRLDCDYMLSNELIAELDGLRPDQRVGGYIGSFYYGIYGRRMVASLYPSKPILFRHVATRARDQGHTEVWDVDGELRVLKNKLTNDDHKPLERWLTAQRRYLKLEADTLEGSTNLKAWLRRMPPIAPIVAFLYCLFVRGLILSGRAGIFYALQRVAAESILALYYLESRLLKSGKRVADVPREHQPRS